MLYGNGDGIDNPAGLEEGSWHAVEKDTLPGTVSSAWSRGPRSYSCKEQSSEFRRESQAPERNAAHWIP